MAALSRDTDARAEARMIECLRRMSPAQRLRRAFDLRAAALEMSRARLRRRYPGIGEDEMRKRLASLWLDRATMIRVYGWDAAKQGY